MGYEEAKKPRDHPFLLKLVKEPKELVRYAAYGWLQSLIVHPWGKRKVLSTAGMLDHLLDRSTESEKLGKEWKFAIVQGLGARVNIHHDMLERIQHFINDGPFFAGSQTAVEGLHM
jgi:26S proteasome non-ATPase regulatory subunit 5